MTFLTSVWSRLQRARAWAGLSTRAALALIGAVAVLAASAVVLLGVGEDVTRHNGSSRADPRLVRFFVEHRPAWLVSAARAVTAFGEVPVLLVAAVVIAAVLWWRGQSAVVAFAPAFALCCTGALVAIGKHLVDRPRPEAALRLVAETDGSFPSGHAADSAAFYGALAIVVAVVLLRRPLARLGAMVAAGVATGAIGGSRLVLAVHWPTDVIAGWALGLFFAVLVGTGAAIVSESPPPDSGSQLVRAHLTRHSRF